MNNGLKRVLRLGYYWSAQIWDPVRTGRGVGALGWFVKDYRRYSSLPGAEKLRAADTMPVLHEKSSTHEIDAHYFFVNAWAARRILAVRPKRHVDVASQTTLAGILSAVIPVTYIDFRKLDVNLDQLDSEQGNILALRFADSSIESLSCLHVAEHIGLGRYGDELDPAGTRKAAQELTRVLAHGGNLFFALPIGRPRVCFNAHRVHAPETICEYFRGLDLVSFAAVDDEGKYHDTAAMSDYNTSAYACGMFHFRKAAS